MSKYQRNFDATEKVLHKLLGAAYQMTFDGQYDMAVQTSVTAVTYWRKVQDGSMDAEEASALIGDSSANDEKLNNEQSTEPAKADGGAAAKSPDASEPRTEIYTCETCGREFDSLAAVNGHQAAHKKKTKSRSADSKKDDESTGLEALFDSGEPPTDNTGQRTPVNPGTIQHEIGKILVYGANKWYDNNELADRVTKGKPQSVQPQLTRMKQAGWINAERSSPNEGFRYSATERLKRRVEKIAEQES